MSGRPKRAGKSPVRPKPSDEDSWTPSKSTATRGRAKSPGRPKSPARTKSPARGRTKSPARPKSPGRPKSPARKAKQRSISPLAQKKVISEKTTKTVSPIRAMSDVFVSLKKEKFDEPLSTIIRKDLLKVEDGLNSKRASSSAESTVTSLTTTVRRSTRQTGKKENDEKIEEFQTFASISSRSKSVEQSLEIPREFGGWFGSLIFILSMPATALAVQLYCSKDKCGSSFTISYKWQQYLDLEAAGWYLAFIASQIIFSYLPLGKLVDAQPSKAGRYQYRCNGLWSLILTMATLGTLCYLKYPVVRVFDKQLQLAVISILFGLLLSIVLYIRARKADVSSLNPYGQSGNFLRDFWMGREINPRIGRLDIKLLLFRTAIIGMVVLNALYVFKVLDSQTVKTEAGNIKISWAQKEYPPALLVSVGLQLIYLLDTLWFEYSYPASFDAQYEGTGYMLAVGFSTYPFIASLVTKFLVVHKVETQWYVLALISLVFIVGYVIYRGSNLQKNNFRQNPLDPSLAQLETISTSRGKKLLVSGWWGFVRHPNYLGDLIMHWAIASICGLAHWLPYTVALLTTVLLLHRAVRDNARCQSRYGVYWERYTARVKSLVIPKIF